MTAFAASTSERRLALVALVMILAAAPLNSGCTQAPAKIIVTPATVALAVGESARIAVELRDASGGVLRQSAMSWASSNPALVRVSADGTVMAVATGRASVKVSAGDKWALATVTVTPAAPSTLTSVEIARTSSRTPPSKRPTIRTQKRGTSPEGKSASPVAGLVAPNKPHGHTLYTSRDFRSKATSSTDFVGSQGWETLESTYPLHTVINDPSAPGSPPSVAHYNFRKGVISGGGPASMRYSAIPNKSARSLYVATWVKYSPNFESYHCKIYYIRWTGGSWFLLMSQNPNDFDALYLTLSPNDANFQYGNLQISKPIRRNQWHLIELVMQFSSTSNAPDGSVKVWIDGAVGLDRSNLAIPGGPPYTEVRYSTIYRPPIGMGTSVPFDMWMDWDHVVVAGR